MLADGMTQVHLQGDLQLHGCVSAQRQCPDLQLYKALCN